MNSLTNAENLKKLSEREIELGIAGTTKSWHNIYRDSAWIFVGGLPMDLTEGDVICIFSQFGEIVNINMVRDKKTGKTKGFAFICYEDQRSTIIAVDNFNLSKVLQRTLRVDHVKDYRPPDEDDKNADDITKKVRAEGVAPRPLTPSESSEDEDLMPMDSKQEKKKKKKEKKMKKEKRMKKKDEKIKDENHSPPKPRIKEEPASPSRRHNQDRDGKSRHSPDRNGREAERGGRIKQDSGYHNHHHPGSRLRDADVKKERKNSPEKTSSNSRNRSRSRSLQPVRRDRERRRSRDRSPETRQHRSPETRQHRSPPRGQHSRSSPDRNRAQKSSRRRSRSNERRRSRSRSRERRRSRSPHSRR